MLFVLVCHEIEVKKFIWKCRHTELNFGWKTTFGGKKKKKKILSLKNG